LSGAVPLKAIGAANLRSPTGACPNGIPKYSETSESFVAGCPLTGPLLVLTVCPTVQLAARSSRSVAKAHNGATRAKSTKDLMAESTQAIATRTRGTRDNEERHLHLYSASTSTTYLSRTNFHFNSASSKSAQSAIIEKSGPTLDNGTCGVRHGGSLFPMRLAHHPYPPVSYRGATQEHPKRTRAGSLGTVQMRRKRHFSGYV
jgi:hypothetical protein